MSQSAPTLPVADAVLMTMAGIAYGSPANIQAYLDEAGPTAGDWAVAWLAALPDPPVNFAYLAVRRSDRTAVIAIRGTYPDPFSCAYWDDANQDSPFGDMQDWPGAPGARVSAGTATGLGGLLALTDAAGGTLAAAVAALPRGAPVVVTGHSLGGTLAPVLALQLSQALPRDDVAAVSFAGMTPGNADFASLFATLPVRRVYNDLDTVSYGWDQVFATHDFYQPAPQGGPIVAAMLLATAARLALGGYAYAPVGEPVPLSGTLSAPTITCTLIAYVLENLHQHLPDTYLALLGAPPLPFTIGFGTVVAPRRIGEPPALIRSEPYFV